MNSTKAPHENQAVLLWFYEQFPQAFSARKKQVKPLQRGIMEDIVDIYERLDVAPFSRKRLRQGLNYYTSSKAYLLSQQEGVYRVDLFGNEVEKVDKAQAKYASERFQTRYGEK